GDREFGTLDVVGYLKDQGAEKRLSELAEQLGLPDSDVAHELERLGIVPLEEPEAPEAPPEAAAAPAEAAAPVPPPFVRAPKGGAKAAAVVEEAEEEEEAPAPTGDEEDLPSLGKPVNGKPVKGAALAAKGQKPS